QRQGEANRDGSKASGCTLVSYAEYDQQKKHSHDHFADQSRQKRIAAGGMCSVAVRRKSLGNVKAWSTTGYDVEHAACNDSAKDLRHDVGEELVSRETT